MSSPLKSLDQTILRPVRAVSEIRLPIASSRDTQKCVLHALCNSCRDVLSRSSIMRRKTPFISNISEEFTLHSSLGELEIAVRKRCHLCTLLSCKLDEFEVDKKVWRNEPVVVEITERCQRSEIREIYYFNVYVPKMESQRKRAYDLLIGVEHEQRRLQSPWSDAKSDIDTHPISNTSSEEHMKLSRYWLNECSRKHVKCQKADRNFMPTRLIQIDKTDSSLLRIHVSRNQQRPFLYATLSHSWGGTKDILAITSQNLDSLCSGFEIWRLPKTFRDAIAVTSSLGLSYLWIDCLCILQDSENDWVYESSRMGATYRNSSCTIAAMWGTTPHDGCFIQRDPLTYEPCRIAVSESEAVLAYPPEAFKADYMYSIADSHLNSRGWVLQESCLSPRMLCFTKFGMVWACQVGDASEAEVNGRSDATTPFTRPEFKEIFGSSVNKIDWIATSSNVRRIGVELLKISARTHELKGNRESGEDFSAKWFQVIEDYSRRQLTVSNDKLIALSAIAQHVQDETSLNYVAGLWEQNLSSDLLWAVADGRSYGKRSSVYRAPTWSWASVDGHITWAGMSHRHETIDSLVKINSVKLLHHSSDLRKTGQVFGGDLRLSGFLKQPSSIIPGKPGSFDGSIQIKLDCFKLSDHGTDLGILHPDILLSQEQVRKIELLLIRKYMSYGFTSSDGLGQTLRIQGLALVPYLVPSVYQRVGFFEFSPSVIGLPGAEWFSDTQERHIWIR